MELYSLGDVQATTDGPTAFYGFDVIVDLGRPLLNIAFETQKEAEAVHIAIKPIVAQAKLITAFPTSWNDCNIEKALAGGDVWPGLRRCEVLASHDAIHVNGPDSSNELAVMKTPAAGTGVESVTE
jgi:hypothetical protein